MLGRHDGYGLEPRWTGLKSLDQRRQLDGFGSRAENDRDFHPRFFRIDQAGLLRGTSQWDCTPVSMMIRQGHL